MTEEKRNLEDLTRTIVLVYGMLENGNPFWLFAAVKPSQYQTFQAAYKDGKVDLYDFKPYGEIIISGEGKSPPDDVILKLAEMYQTTPEVLAKAVGVVEKAKEEDK